VDGKGRGNVVTLGRGSSIEGCEIRNGTIGVLCRMDGGKILRCRIIRNSGTGILCIGAMPHIIDNVIAYNGGSGIQLRSARAKEGETVDHNTIVHNGNHGILLEDVSGLLQNNIIAFNERLGISNQQSSPNFSSIDNNVFCNHAGEIQLSSGNFTADPLFAEPKSRGMNFSLQPNSPCVEKASDGTDLGARLAGE
jgi:hypothetical protein